MGLLLLNFLFPFLILQYWHSIHINKSSLSFLKIEERKGVWDQMVKLNLMFIVFSNLSHMIQANQEHYHQCTDGDIIESRVTKPHNGRLRNKIHLFPSLQIPLPYWTTTPYERSSLYLKAMITIPPDILQLQLTKHCHRHNVI